MSKSMLLVLEKDKATLYFEKGAQNGTPEVLARRDISASECELTKIGKNGRPIILRLTLRDDRLWLRTEQDFLFPLVRAP